MRKYAKFYDNLLENLNQLKNIWGTSLVVQWLTLHTPSAGGPGSIPGQGTIYQMLQLRVRMLQLKIPHAATKILNQQRRSCVPQLRPGTAK